MKKTLIFLMVGFLLMGTLFGCASKPAATPGEMPYKIGVINSLTGEFSVYAVDFQKGIEFAVNDINRAGGVNGRPIELVVLDDESEPVNAASNVRALANTDVLAMVGMADFGLALAAAPVIEEVKLPTVQLAPIDPPYEEPGGYNFGGIWWTMDRVTEARLRACKDVGLSRLAFLMPQDPVGEITAEMSIAMAPELGIEIVGVEWMLGTDSDVTPQLVKLREANPDAIINGGSGRAAVVMFKSLKRLGWDIPMIALDSNATPAFIEAMGEDADIVHVWAPASALKADTIPGTHPTRNLLVEFAQKWEQEMGAAPATMEVQGYDAIRSLGPILKEVNPDPANEDLQSIRNRIRDALEQQHFQGLDWEISRSPQDHKGAGAAVVWVARVDGTGFVPITAADLK